MSTFETMIVTLPHYMKEKTWYVTESEGGWFICNPSCRIYAQKDSGKNGYREAHKGKVLLQGVYPEFEGRDYFDAVLHGSVSDPELRRPSITVAYTRGPAAVAKAIETRLLPEYEAKKKRAVDWYNMELARRDRKESHADMLRKYKPDSMRAVGDDGRTTRMDFKLNGSPKVNCVVLINPYDASIGIHLTGLELEDALEALNAIAGGK